MSCFCTSCYKIEKSGVQLIETAMKTLKQYNSPMPCQRPTHLTKSRIINNAPQSTTLSMGLLTPLSFAPPLLTPLIVNQCPFPGNPPPHLPFQLSRHSLIILL